MTSRDLYESVNIELNKENAPNILLEDFNYFANKAIYQYINKRYNLYDINQQTTDDLRVLKSTCSLTPKKVNGFNELSLASLATYEVTLPLDYLHLLNCICIYKVKKTYKCYNIGDTWRASATRLTSDGYSQILDNFWNRPTYKRPYYYIHNTNTSDKVPTDLRGSHTESLLPNNYLLGTDSNPRIDKSNFLLYIPIITEEGETKGKSMAELDFGIEIINGYACILKEGKYCVKKTSIQIDSETINRYSFLYFDLKAKKFRFVDNLENSRVEDNHLECSEYNYGTMIQFIEQGKVDSELDYVKIDCSDYFNEIRIHPDTKTSLIQKSAEMRYGNVSLVRMEIRYGTDDSVFELTKVYIDYIKSPLHIRLTLEELDYTEDMSQLLEYPDYVCQEIVNELVHLIMENIGDPKLQTHPLVTLSIATQQLTPVQAAGAAQ